MSDQWTQAVNADALRAAMARSSKWGGYTAGLSLSAVAKAGPIDLDVLSDAERKEIWDWLENDVLDPPTRVIDWERRVGSFALGGT